MNRHQQRRLIVFSFQFLKTLLLVQHVAQSGEGPLRHQLKTHEMVKVFDPKLVESEPAGRRAKWTMN